MISQKPLTQYTLKTPSNSDHQATKTNNHVKHKDQDQQQPSNDFHCMMSEHIADMRELRDAQFETALQTRALTGSMEALTSQIGNGISLGVRVISLFNQVIYVFLAVVLGMGVMIVWLAHVDIAYDKGGLSIKQPVASNDSQGTQHDQGATF